MDANISF